MKKIRKSIITLGLGLLVAGGLQSCRDKDLEPSLEQQKDINSISTQEDLKAFMNGIYNLMRDTSYLGLRAELYGEVRTDNAYAKADGSGRFVQVGGMNYLPSLSDTAGTWYRIYQVIARCNFVINKGIDNLSGDKETLKHYLGEAYAIRAMAHFDLVRFFGQTYIGGAGKDMNALGVPYVKIYKGDPNNLYPARNTVQEDYNFAKEDIEKAVSLMDESNGVRFDEGGAHYMISTAAWAVLSRMAIYFKDYPTAKKAAKKVLDDTKFSIVTKEDYVDSWKSKNTPDNVIFAIFAQSDTEAVGLESLGSLYRKIGSAGYGDILALEDLYDTFGDGDIRRSKSMISKSNNGIIVNLGKYVDNTKGTDNIPIFRYEEAVLDYSEALLGTGETGEALTWLNKIPANRGASSYTQASMDNILKERRKEFAFEGLRFDDLVRTGKGIPLVDNSKQLFGGTIPAGDYRLAFPIPDTEMKVNHNMKQNKGY